MAIRLSFLIIGSSVMTLTTTPNNLTDGMESLMKPLRRLRVPVHEIAMMMSIALRFIPILLEETDKIMKAQMARGADFDSGNLIQKAKSLGSAAGSSVHIGVPPGQRSGDGDGSALLPGRRRKNEDEASDL